jgi:hypothetical protein
MAGEASLVLIITFSILSLLGLPLAIALVASSLAAVTMMVPVDMALFTSAQKMVASLDSFSLLAVPFFYSLWGDYELWRYRHTLGQFRQAARRAYSWFLSANQHRW